MAGFFFFRDVLGIDRTQFLFFSLLFLGSVLKTIDTICKFNAGNVTLYKYNYPFIQICFYLSLHILVLLKKKKEKHNCINCQKEKSQSKMV